MLYEEKVNHEAPGGAGYAPHQDARAYRFVDRHVCPTCMGVGTVQRERTVELSLPRPVRDGQTLRLRGLGEPGEGGEAGDLLLTLRLAGDDVFRLPCEELENKFVKESTAAGLDGLEGHRSVGGMRASIYNAFPEEGIDALVAFMQEFEKKTG